VKQQITQQQHATRRNPLRHGNIDFKPRSCGDKLWKTSDPELDRHLRQSFEGEAPKFQRPIEMEIHGLVGKRSR